MKGAGKAASERDGQGMSESHFRAFGATLGLVDEALCEFERWALGRAARGVIFEEINDLSLGKRKKLLDGINAVRGSIKELQDRLGLEKEQLVVSHAIWVKCSGFWEMLVELESSHLKRYGPVPPKLAQELDAQVTRINRQFQGLSTLVRARDSTGKPKDPGK